MMYFRIADTFTDSLARLQADERRAAKTTAFDLQLDSTRPGMQANDAGRSPVLKGSLNTGLRVATTLKNIGKGRLFVSGCQLSLEDQLEVLGVDVTVTRAPSRGDVLGTRTNADPQGDTR